MRYVKLFIFAAVFIAIVDMVVSFVYSGYVNFLLGFDRYQPYTEITFTNEEVNNQDYVLYQHVRHSTQYMLVTRKRIPTKKREKIASQEPFSKGTIHFVHGPKWLRWRRNYSNGQKANTEHSDRTEIDIIEDIVDKFD